MSGVLTRNGYIPSEVLHEIARSAEFYKLAEVEKLVDTRKALIEASVPHLLSLLADVDSAYRSSFTSKKERNRRLELVRDTLIHSDIRRQFTNTTSGTACLRYIDSYTDMMNSSEPSGRAEKRALQEAASDAYAAAKRSLEEYAVQTASGAEDYREALKVNSKKVGLSPEKRKRFAASDAVIRFAETQAERRDQVDSRVDWHARLYLDHMKTRVDFESQRPGINFHNSKWHFYTGESVVEVPKHAAHLTDAQLQDACQDLMSLQSDLSANVIRPTESWLDEHKAEWEAVGRHSDTLWRSLPDHKEVIQASGAAYSSEQRKLAEATQIHGQLDTVQSALTSVLDARIKKRADSPSPSVTPPAAARPQPTRTPSPRREPTSAVAESARLRTRRVREEAKDVEAHLSDLSSQATASGLVNLFIKSNQRLADDLASKIQSLFDAEAADNPTLMEERTVLLTKSSSLAVKRRAFATFVVAQYLEAGRELTDGGLKALVDVMKSTKDTKLIHEIYLAAERDHKHQKGFKSVQESRSIKGHPQSLKLLHRAAKLRLLELAYQDGAVLSKSAQSQILNVHHDSSFGRFDTASQDAYDSIKRMRAMGSADHKKFKSEYRRFNGKLFRVGKREAETMSRLGFSKPHSAPLFMPREMSFGPVAALNQRSLRPRQAQVSVVTPVSPATSEPKELKPADEERVDQTMDVEGAVGTHGLVERDGVVHFVPRDDLPATLVRVEVGDQIQVQRQVQAERIDWLKAQVEVQRVLIEERGAAIDGLCEAVADVCQIFKDLAVLVDEQGKSIAKVDEYASSAKSHMGSAVEAWEDIQRRVQSGESFPYADAAKIFSDYDAASRSSTPSTMASTPASSRGSSPYRVTDAWREGHHAAAGRPAPQHAGAAVGGPP